MRNATLNKEFIEQYKSVFADQLIQQKYGENTHLTGKEILQLTPSKQLNFFILKILFTEWQDEMKKLESPYFDYKNADVRKSMVSLMNTLSQHIRVAASDMTVLSGRALEGTVLLTISPQDYVIQELSGKQQQVLNEKAIKQLLKYVVVYKDQIEAFYQSQIGLNSEQILEKIDENFPEIEIGEATETLATELSEILVVNKSDLIELDSNKILGEAVLGQGPVIVEPADQMEEIRSEPQGVQREFRTKDQHDKTEPPTGENIEEPKTESIEESESAIVTEDVSEQETVNDLFEVEAKTLADIHEEKQIDSIMDAISINHRYMFLQELFDGDNAKFTQAIENVEEADSFDNAVETLVQNYAKDLDWDMNSDEVKELLKVIFRKYR